MKDAILPVLLLAALAPAGASAQDARPSLPSLDLSVPRESIPSGELSRTWSSAPRQQDAQLPDLGAGVSRPAGQSGSRRGAMRADLPYGAGYEARQAEGWHGMDQGAGQGASQGTGQAMGQGMGQGASQGMGRGRGR